MDHLYHGYASHNQMVLAPDVQVAADLSNVF